MWRLRTPDARIEDLRQEHEVKSAIRGGFLKAPRESCARLGGHVGANRHAIFFKTSDLPPECMKLGIGRQVSPLRPGPGFASACHRLDIRAVLNGGLLLIHPPWPDLPSRLVFGRAFFLLAWGTAFRD